MCKMRRWCILVDLCTLPSPYPSCGYDTAATYSRRSFKTGVSTIELSNDAGSSTDVFFEATTGTCALANLHTLTPEPSASATRSPMPYHALAEPCTPTRLASTSAATRHRRPPATNALQRKTDLRRPAIKPSERWSVHWSANDKGGPLMSASLRSRIHISVLPTP